MPIAAPLHRSTAVLAVRDASHLRRPVVGFAAAPLAVAAIANLILPWLVHEPIVRNRPAQAVLSHVYTWAPVSLAGRWALFATGGAAVALAFLTWTTSGFRAANLAQLAATYAAFVVAAGAVLPLLIVAVAAVAAAALSIVVWVVFVVVIVGLCGALLACLLSDL